VAYYYKVKSRKARSCYILQKDGFASWDQASHAQEYMVFPKNTTTRLAIDESSLSQDELNTFISSRDTAGRKGKLVAVVSSTRSEKIAGVLHRIPKKQRELVEEVTLDMASSMRKACELAFPNAVLVTDRFHVVRLVMDALQHVRIDQRWKELDIENQLIKKARSLGTKYKPLILSNGDTPKQLLPRAKYALYKMPHQWTITQIHRISLLFQMYPKIERAYRLAWDFRKIYQITSKSHAFNALSAWMKQAKDASIEHFEVECDTIDNHLEGILAFFNNRSTNAHAESFNAQIKLFRANLRGVNDPKIFLYRLQKVFA
jgi:transposase